VTHLLDTSAFLAFLFDEPGAEQVRRLFEDGDKQVAVSVLTKVEYWARLKTLRRERHFEGEWNLALPLFHAVLGIDDAVAERALALRRAATRRLPTIDALIAATAAVHGLALVHRDPHFRSIPSIHLSQLDVEATQ
jgi:predicted nucleic acid-binding protein